jgi:phage baseplate assembly protein gpV
VLKFGIITKIDPITARARVKFAEDDHQSFWLPILQAKTMNDKFYVLPDIGEQAACLMDENFEDGVVLGTIYSSEDIPKNQTTNEIALNLENGSFANIDKENDVLTLAFSKVKIIGDIENEGNFKNTLGIISDSDITDEKSSMQAMRDVFNPHTHTGNQGSATSNPSAEM